MAGTLSESILPRRKSATKATRAFAGQLDSTDDDDDDSQASGGSDGEPKRRNASKKGRGRGRKAAQKNYVGKRIKASALTHPMSAGPRQVSTGQESTRPKPIVKRKSSPVGDEESNACVKLNSIAVLGDTQCKQALLNSWDGFSDLSSLTDESRSPSPDSEVELLESPPPNTVWGSACHSALGHKQVQWTAQDLGPYVWVLIEPTNLRVFDPDLDKNDHQDRLWWPGKIISTSSINIPLQVRLFKLKNVAITAPCEENIVSKLDTLGRWRFKYPTFVSSPLSRQQQQEQQQHLISASPRKKSKFERKDIDSKRREATERRWKDAVEEMRREEEEEEGSDYLPEIGEMSTRPIPFTSAIGNHNSPYDEKSNRHGKKKNKRKRADLSDDNSSDTFWEPPGPDETLQIPGELVLARESGNDAAAATHQVAHWPAKILAYVPPSNRKQQPKYRVKWLDGTEGLINRSWFYTVAEEDFGNCKLGVFESSVTEVANDDENEDIDAVKARWDFSRRSLSPEVTDPPRSMEEFREFAVRLQFAYTKPVLKAILNKEYGPVMELHSFFMAGGSKRVRLNQHSSRRGTMDMNEVEELTKYLQEWCLRSRPKSGTLDRDTNGEDEEVEILNLKQPESLEQCEPSNSAVEAGMVIELDDGECRASSPPITEDVPTSPPSSSLPSREEPDPPEGGLAEGTFPSPPSAVQIIPDNDQMVNQPQRPPRQKGCDEYESLTELDKLHYCTTILLSECIRQILLWKSGARTSIELLDEDAEQDLFDEGDKLLNEKDWVFDIKRARQRAESLLKPNSNETWRRRTQPVNYCELGD